MSKPTIVFAQGQDELTRIPGIGEKFAQRLIEAGVVRYDQLALMSDEDILAILSRPKLPGWNLAHVQEMHWPEHAARLVAEQRERNPIMTYESPVAENDPGDVEFVPIKANVSLEENGDHANRQHYATFTVRLLVGEQGVIRRTKVEHVETGTPGTWPGLDGERLLAFIMQNSLTELSGSRIEPAADSSTAPGRLSIPSGNLTLGKIKVQTVRGEGAKGLAREDQPFAITVLLDGSAIQPNMEGMGYRLSIYAHKVGQDGHRKLIANTVGISPAQDRFSIRAEDISLSQGVYHLDALIQLTPADKPDEPYTELFAMTEGYRLTVY